jgi:5-methylcytosine-specific restriction protein A
MAALADSGLDGKTIQEEFDDGFQEAPEGRLLTRIHLVRERNRKLVKRKLEQALKKSGRLICEVCNFDFVKSYGNHGVGFMECHHLKPVTQLSEGHQTRLEDLALICANCHRMIHRRRPWLSVVELKKMIRTI